MDPSMLLSGPYPGLVLLLFSLAWLARHRYRTDALAEVLGSVEAESPSD